MFVRFGPGHLIALAVIAATVVAAARAARREQGRRYVRWSLAALLGVGITAYFAGEAAGGTLNGWDFLPFHLSDFTVFLAIYALASLRRGAAELLYFLAVPALLAIATPDLDRGFGDWYSLVFFVLHGGVIAAAAALTFGFGLAPRKGAVVRAFLFTNAYAAFAALLNLVLGTNFLYLRHKPEQPSPLDWFGGWPWYLVAGEVAALVLFSLAYLPFAPRGHGTERRPAPDP